MGARLLRRYKFFFLSRLQPLIEHPLKRSEPDILNNTIHRETVQGSGQHIIDRRELPTTH